MIHKLTQFSISKPLAEYLNRLIYLKYKKTSIYINYPHLIHELTNSSCFLFGSLIKAYSIYYLLKISYHINRYYIFNYNTPSTMGNDLGSNMNAPLIPPLKIPFVYDNEVFLIRIMKII